jgi:hypothetical protein
MAEYSLLIPHDTGEPWRQQLVDWCAARWRAHLPEAEVLVAGVGATPPNRSANRNLLAEKATTDLLAFVDADICSAIQAVRDAVELARTEALVKFNTVVWVHKRGTQRLLRTDPGATLAIYPEDIQKANRPGDLIGLGFFMRREVLEAVNGWDERFRGWGHEDPSLTAAIETLVGPMRRIAQPAYHLWHPRQTSGGEHDKSTPEFLERRALGRRYLDARSDVQTMRKLVAGCR